MYPPPPPPLPKVDKDARMKPYFRVQTGNEFLFKCLYFPEPCVSFILVSIQHFENEFHFIKYTDQHNLQWIWQQLHRVCNSRQWFSNQKHNLQIQIRAALKHLWCISYHAPFPVKCFHADIVLYPGQNKKHKQYRLCFVVFHCSLVLIDLPPSPFPTTIHPPTHPPKKRSHGHLGPHLLTLYK